MNLQSERRFEAAFDTNTLRPARPAQPKKHASINWLGWAVVALIAFGLHQLSVTGSRHEAPAAPVVAATPAPTPRPVPVPVAAAPRAEMLHVRALGTTENERMPDGRILTTLYKGELPDVAHLPTKGAQLGDMWFTRADGRCWVLAPVAAGSQTVGWVDP